MNNKTLLAMTLVITLSLVFSGGAVAKPKNIKDFDDYFANSMEDGDFLPTKEMVNDKKKRVAVTPVEILSEQQEEYSQIAVLMRNRLEDLVGKVGVLMDRGVSARLGNELGRIELTEGMTPTDNVNTGNAQIAIVPSVISITGGSMDKAAESGENMFGKEYTSAQKCVLTIELETTVKLVTLDTMEIDSIHTQGSGSVTVENTTCRAGLMQANLATLTSNAIQDVAREVYGPLSSMLIPTAYVLERRTLTKKEKVRGNLFKITLGSDDGIGDASKVTIYSKRSFFNKLTEETEIDRIKIADATITNKINSKSSWLFVKDNTQASRVRLGDIVEITVKSKSGGFNLFGDILGELGL